MIVIFVVTFGCGIGDWDGGGIGDLDWVVTFVVTSVETFGCNCWL